MIRREVLRIQLLGDVSKSGVLYKKDLTFREKNPISQSPMRVINTVFPAKKKQKRNPMSKMVINLTLEINIPDKGLNHHYG